MDIQLNTDHTIEGREQLAAHVKGVVNRALTRFSQQITRIEVHLSDENGHKGGPRARPPTAVTHQAPTLNQAIDGAADKIAHVLEGDLGRLRERR